MDSKNNKQRQRRQYQRHQNNSISNDPVKNIVLKEGRTARNLIVWNVPLNRFKRRSSSETKSAPPNFRSRTPPISNGLNDSLNSSTTKFKKSSDVRARYWAFLFDNLRRAVDEIYQTCEQDESALECKEVIMILEQCTNDFKSLIKRMKVMKEFEESDKPTPVAWEVRKISPNKMPQNQNTTNGEKTCSKRISYSDVLCGKRDNEVGQSTDSNPTDDENWKTVERTSRSRVKITPEKKDDFIEWQDLEDEHKEYSGKSWSDLYEAEIEAARTPGRVVHMHEKLSSPARRCSTTEVQRRHELKQEKAQELRNKLQKEITDKMRGKWNKVENVRASKEKIRQWRREKIQKRQERAEQNRKQIIEQIIKQAKDEEIKGREIAFIQSLEETHKRHDIMNKDKDWEARLSDLQAEQARKREEKAAKEAAAEARRKELEAERQAKLTELQEKRKQQEAEREARQLQKDAERVQAARNKERERTERLATLEAQKQEQIRSLQQRIEKKQTESARRHTEHLEGKREKAFEMSVVTHSTSDETLDTKPILTPYDKKKLCTLCGVLITCEVQLQSHLRGKRHMQAVKEKLGSDQFVQRDLENVNLQHMSDVPADRPDPQLESEKERQKVLKRRLKKLRQRMSNRATTFERDNRTESGEATLNGKLKKLLLDLSRNNGQCPNERTLNELIRSISSTTIQSKQSSSIAKRLCQNALNPTFFKPPLNIKSLQLAANALNLLVQNDSEMSSYLLKSNYIATIIDLLSKQLVHIYQSTEEKDPDELLLAERLFQIIATTFSKAPNSIAVDAFSYLICASIFDTQANMMRTLSLEIDGVWSLFREGLIMVTEICKLARLNEQNKEEFLTTIRSTELLEVVTLMYSVLLYLGEKELDDEVASLLSQALEFVNTLALLDLKTLQNMLCVEGTCLELRHLAAFILKQPKHERVVNEIITAVGFFTSQCIDAQTALQTGQPPTVLQLLSSLPVDYFTQVSLMKVLMPTLIAATYENPANLKIISAEVSPSLLVSFIKDEMRLKSDEKSLLHLSHRLPSNEWERAIEYFSKQ